MKTLGILVLSLLSTTAVAAGLWAWQQSQDFVLDWGFGRPNVAEWAVRSAAVAVISAAQVVLIILVAGRVYRRGTVDSVLALTAGVVCALASVSAIACGFAGR